MCSPCVHASKIGGDMRFIFRVIETLQIGFSVAGDVMANVWRMNLGQHDKLTINIEFEVHK